MAITKILTINDSGEKFAGKHLKRAIEYIIDSAKTQEQRYVSGINCQPQDAFVQMKSTKQKFGKTDKRQGYHIVISFEETNVDPALAFEIVGKFVREYLGDVYEAVYAVHDNTEHTHGHIIFNSVNYRTGRKYRYEKGDWAKKIQPITNRLCEEYGLATIDIEMEGVGKNEHYKDWNDFRDGQFIWRDMIKRDLDACVMQANSFEKFLVLLREKGYEIKQNKYLAIKPPGMQRFCRCKSLGDNYTEDALKQRIDTDTLVTYAQREHKEQMYSTEGLENEFLKRTKLSGIQKTYYAKVCRVRGIEKLPYSKAWQYRDEIRKMKETYEQYLFLVKNDIHSLVELVAVRDNLELKKAECQKEKKMLYREKKRFEPLFRIVDKMEELQPGENSFQSGDAFFEEEHKAYVRLKSDLKEQGYSLETVEHLRLQCQAKISGNYEKTRAVAKYLKIANEMFSEITERAIERRQEQLRKQEKEIEHSVKKQPI